MSDWIRYKDNPPKEGGWYLIVYMGETCEACYHKGMGWEIYGVLDEEVTWWMHRPAPPLVGE